MCDKPLTSERIGELKVGLPKANTMRPGPKVGLRKEDYCEYDRI